MRNQGRPTVPASHDIAERCAHRCALIIASLLRPEEFGEAVMEFTEAIKEELDAIEKPDGFSPPAGD